ALFDRLDAETHGEVALADAGRALDEQGLGVADPAAGGEQVDLAALDRGLEGEVELRQRLSGGKARQAQSRLHAPGLSHADLGFEKGVEGVVRAGVFLDGLGEHARSGVSNRLSASQELITEVPVA